MSTLSEILAARLDGKQWPPAEPFATAFAMASRTVGKAPLVLQPGEAVEWPLVGWCLDDLARVVLLITDPARAEETYRQGDNRERAAIMRALPFLPHPQSFVPLAVDACRTSVQPVFEAIACENPFPGKYFPELSFNQLVLKALFIEVPLQRIVGLERRLTAELSRMAADYAKERSAAGRTVPADIARLTQ